MTKGVARDIESGIFIRHSAELVNCCSGQISFVICFYDKFKFVICQLNKWKMLSMKFDGGKAVVQRILQAYGFTMQKQLHDHLGVGNGTVSTWIKRNYFPGEVVIRCALETGADLEWLATGRDNVSSMEVVNNKRPNFNNISHKAIVDGCLNTVGIWIVDLSALELKEENLFLLTSGAGKYLVNENVYFPEDGLWLIEREGVYSVNNIKKAPNNNWQIDGVMWPKDDVLLHGKVIRNIIKSGV